MVVSQALAKLSGLPDRLVVEVEIESSVAIQERCVCCFTDLCLICVCFGSLWQFANGLSGAALADHDGSFSALNVLDTF